MFSKIIIKIKTKCFFSSTTTKSTVFEDEQTPTRIPLKIVDVICFQIQIRMLDSCIKFEGFNT